jgi:hypothetical protein
LSADGFYPPQNPMMPPQGPRPMQPQMRPAMPGQGPAQQPQQPPEVEHHNEPTFTVKLRKRPTKGRCCINVVPPEEFRISRRAPSIDYAAAVREIGLG